MLGIKVTTDPKLPLTLQTSDWPGQTFWYLTDANGDVVGVQSLLGAIAFTGSKRNRVLGLKRSLESNNKPGISWRDGQIVDVHPMIDLMV